MGWFVEACIAPDHLNGIQSVVRNFADLLFGCVRSDEPIHFRTRDFSHKDQLTATAHRISIIYLDRTETRGVAQAPLHAAEGAGVGRSPRQAVQGD